MWTHKTFFWVWKYWLTKLSGISCHCLGPLLWALPIEIIRQICAQPGRASALPWNFLCAYCLTFLLQVMLAIYFSETVPLRTNESVGNIEHCQPTSIQIANLCFWALVQWWCISFSYISFSLHSITVFQGFFLANLQAVLISLAPGRVHVLISTALGPTQSSQVGDDGEPSSVFFSFQETWCCEKWEQVIILYPEWGEIRNWTDNVPLSSQIHKKDSISGYPLRTFNVTCCHSSFLTSAPIYDFTSRSAPNTTCCCPGWKQPISTGTIRFEMWFPHLKKVQNGSISSLEKLCCQECVFSMVQLYHGQGTAEKEWDEWGAARFERDRILDIYIYIYAGAMVRWCVTRALGTYILTG